MLLAPVLAFAWAAPDWVPANDPALMGLQALDVGSSDTPLTGQPSTSAIYVDESRHVDHLGPLHFYLLAGPMRLLGADTGMLAVSLLINGACLLIAAWATFRRLGPMGGMLGAAILSLVTFTVGAAGLVDPVSSEIARYPLLCSAVLIWGLLRGDVRLLPLTTAVVSFTAQQHLSVLPAIAVLSAAGIVGFVYVWGRGGRWRERTGRRALLVWGGSSVAIAVAMWLPVLLQQLTSRPGNLTMLARLAGDSDRPTLGLMSAVRQLAHVLGLPPLLGRTDLTGVSFLSQPSLVTWVSAGVVLGVVAILGSRWMRTSPDLFTMVVMVGLLLVAGLVNGSNVLDSAEAWRMIMYHWAFPLAFFVALSLAMAVAQGTAPTVRRLASAWPTARRAWVLPALVVIALLVIVVPGLLNPALERESNRLVAAHSPIERRYVDAVVDELMAHRDRFDEGAILVLSQGAVNFSNLRETATLYLAQEQVDVRLPPGFQGYVPDSRLVEPESAAGGLLLVEDHGAESRDVNVGDLIADVDASGGLDVAAYRALLDQFERAELRLGPAVEDALDDLPDAWLHAVETGDLGTAIGAASEETLEALPAGAIEQTQTLLRLYALGNDPSRYLLDRELLGFLDSHPLEQPELDPVLIERVLRSAPDGLRADRPMRLRVYLLDPEEVPSVADPSDALLEGPLDNPDNTG